MNQRVLKRVALALLALLMLSTLLSCGKTSSDERDKVMDFSFGGHTISPKTEATDAFLASLGAETRERAESPNCAFDGNNIRYSFAGFEVETYEKSGKTYFYGVYILDDSVSTDGGIAIGSTKEAVTAAYGNADEVRDGSLTYQYHGYSLIFFLKEGRVSRIQCLFNI